MATLTDAVKDNLATQDCLTKILEKQPKRKYVPNSNGPRDYFRDCEVDARMTKRLGQPIDIATTMLYAQRAFTQAHPDSIVDIRKLMADWITKKKVTMEEYCGRDPPATVTPDQLYILFKVHYSAKIKELFTDSTMGTRHRANHTQERTDERLEGIEDGLTELAMALKVVAHDRTVVHNRAVPGSIQVPTGTDTVAGMTLASDPQFQSMVETQRALSAQMQTMMQSMAANQPPAQYRTERTERSNPLVGQNAGGRDAGGRDRSGQFGAMDNICRQYRMWCWSCGVNLSHTGGNCNTHKAGHIDLATFANPQGGNVKKNGRHMKWRHPISGATIDHCINV